MGKYFFFMGLIIDIIFIILIFIKAIINDIGGTNEYGDEYLNESTFYLGIVGFIGFILMVISPLLI